MRSAVVYIFSCSECGAQYVGSTNRSLAIRTAEHAGVKQGARCCKHVFAKVLTTTVGETVEKHLCCHLSASVMWVLPIRVRTSVANTC